MIVPASSLESSAEQAFRSARSAQSGRPSARLREFDTARMRCFREGHNSQIANHLAAIAEPDRGERCILCAEPADKVVLGPIESESGLRRRTPVCTKCANTSGRSERRMVSKLSVD